jgi:hypothetical protein
MPSLFQAVNLYVYFTIGAAEFNSQAGLPIEICELGFVRTRGEVRRV